MQVLEISKSRGFHSMEYAIGVVARVEDEDGISRFVSEFKGTLLDWTRRRGHESRGVHLTISAPETLHEGMHSRLANLLGEEEVSPLFERLTFSATLPTGAGRAKEFRF